jgi:hypothetical protein
MKARSLFAQTAYVVFSRLGLKQRVVYKARPIPGRSRLPQHQPYARSARVNNPVHTLGTAIEALVSAAAHGRLLVLIAVQARDDDVRNLFYKTLKLAVL